MKSYAENSKGKANGQISNAKTEVKAKNAKQDLSHYKSVIYTTSFKQDQGNAASPFSVFHSTVKAQASPSDSTPGGGNTSSNFETPQYTLATSNYKGTYGGKLINADEIKPVQFMPSYSFYSEAEEKQNQEIKEGFQKEGGLENNNSNNEIAGLDTINGAEINSKKEKAIFSNVIKSEIPSSIPKGGKYYLDKKHLKNETQDNAVNKPGLGYLEIISKLGINNKSIFLKQESNCTNITASKAFEVYYLIRKEMPL